ncbi:MAG TPA: short-chain dehydrogenase, partial [Clostridiales bacterium]|nr:short-chain dehydrogenase [Clostridiales bacterium]
MNIAIVTGASSGMGKEFAKKLDEENLDELWLVALSEEKLKQTASELKTKSKIFAYDLTLQENLQKITDALKEQKPNVKW